MNTIKLPGGRRMGFAQYGASNGEPVLFCHGMPGSRLQLTEAMSQAARDMGMRIVAPDRPGYGLSDPLPGRTFLDWAQDAAALMDALGIVRFRVLGYSAGAPFALACAHALPQRVTGVALAGGLAPNLFDPQVVAAWLPAMNGLFAMARDNPAGLADALRAMVHDADTLLATISGLLPAPDKALLTASAFRQDCIETLRQGHEAAATDYILAARDWNFALEEIRAPVHIWHGDEDINVPPLMAKYFASRLPHNQVHLLPGAGHLCLFSHWREILSALVAKETVTATKLSGPFDGQERLAFSASLARDMRQGTPDQLAVPDFERISVALKAGDNSSAKAYFQLAALLHLQLAHILFEWAIEWPNTLARLKGAEIERECTGAAFLSWSEACGTIATNPEAEAALAIVAALLAPDHLGPGVSEAYRGERSKGCDGVAGAFVQALITRHEQALNSIAQPGFSRTITLFESYWRFAIALHDALVQYCHTYPSIASLHADQTTAEQLIRDSFSGASFFEGLWALGSLPPEPLAAFLAEHLRAHFSGHGRGGSVRVVEHPDRYQLVFDACGSGQEMRRRLRRAGKQVEVFDQATPATWHRTGQVPPYCAHCACNEIESIRRFGYPVLLTEFDPDPDRPCGWTVYKNPLLIPDAYFARLGTVKDPSRFRTPAA